jgi:hypothetical protein
LIIVEDVELVHTSDALHEEVEQIYAEVEPVEKNAIRDLTLAQHLQHINHREETALIAFDHSPQLDDQAAALSNRSSRNV